MNTYFIINLDDSKLTEILTYAVEDFETLRKNLDNTKCVLKLPLNASAPEILNNYKSYSHSEILEIMGNSEWSNNEMLMR